MSIALAYPQHQSTALGVKPLLTLEDANAPSISFDGKLVAVVPEVGIVEIYDIASNRRLHIFKVPYTDIAWLSADGKRVAISGDIIHFTGDGHHTSEPRLWFFDIETGKELKQIDTWVEINNSITRNISIGEKYGSLSGDLSLAASSLLGDEERSLAKGSVWLWDIENKKLKGSFGEYQKDDAWQEAKITPDASILAATHYGLFNNTRKGTVVWDTKQGRELLRLPFYCLWLALSDNGQRFVTGNSKSYVTEVWDITKGKRVSYIGTEFKNEKPDMGPGALSPDGRLLATAGEAFVLIWDTTNGRLLTAQCHVADPDEGYVKTVAFSGNGQYLVMSSAGETVKIWRLQDILNNAKNGIKDYLQMRKEQRRNSSRY